jgi:uncharacterized membrane protein
MMHVSKSNAMLAAAALTLALSGSLMTAPSAEAASKVKCYGVNSCKGQSACNTASSSCAGKNSCKGKGWLSLTKAQCKTQGGRVG